MLSAIVGLLIMANAAAVVAAGTPDGDRPRALVALVNCRTIADEKRRVACYDREVATFDAAERERKIIVLDQEQVKTTKRSLFGFALPPLKLFGNRRSEEPSAEKMPNDEIAALDTVVTKIDRLGGGQVAFTVENGARWVQTDDRTLSLARVRAGALVRISRGALGSYFATFNNSIAVKVRRIG